MSSPSLAVLYGTRVVATLTQEPDGTLALEYLPNIVARVPESTPLISIALPVRSVPYRGDPVRAFCDGLLPEGEVRERLAGRLGLSNSNTFGLLEAFGRDCAGALSLVPEDQALSSAASSSVEWLDEAELAARVEALPRFPLADSPEADIRISLAGAQNKMAVVLGPDGRLGLPRGLTPSTHILKPAPRAIRSRYDRRLAFPDLVANEAFCMHLAGASGLSVAQFVVRPVAGDPALLATRYDRAVGSAGVRRLHQEDLCQALGLPPGQKYEAEGGPTLLSAVELVRRHSVTVAEDLGGLLDLVAFNHLIGNADAHGKNFSFLHTPEGIRLAPAYDVLSTVVYPHLARRMAMSVGGVADPEGVEPVHWQKELGRLGLATAYYRERLADLAGRVRAALPESMEWAATQGLSTRLPKEVRALATRRSTVLEHVRSLAAPNSPGLHGPDGHDTRPRRRTGTASWPKPPGS
jgi:serine/threonine-protein kinase HipA